MHKDELRGLKEKDLRRALEELEETWSETLLHGSDEALEEHTQRTRELQREYLRRHPGRERIPGPMVTVADDRPGGEDDDPRERAAGETGRVAGAAEDDRPPSGGVA